MSYYSPQPPQQQPPAYPPPPYMTPAYQPAPSTHTMAIVSLIFGLLGLAGFCPGLGSLIALVAGYSAQGAIRAEPQRYGGGGLATGGIILGWIGMVLMGLGLCAFVLWLLLFGGLAIIGNLDTSLVPALRLLI